MALNNPTTPKTLSIHGAGLGEYKTTWALNHIRDHIHRRTLFIGVGGNENLLRYRLDQIGAQTADLWTPPGSVSLAQIEARIDEDSPEVVVLDGATGFGPSDVIHLKHLAGRQNTALLLSWTIPDNYVARARRNNGRYGLWAIGAAAQDYADYVTTSCRLKDGIVACTIKRFTHKTQPVRVFQFNPSNLQLTSSRMI